MRNKIFISHATPEDNNFGLWLYSRLSALGYDVWIDKNALLGGEKFWEDIDDAIRNKACKVLLVYSQNICYKNTIGKLKDGIYKEYSQAESVAKANNISDFIILLNIDHSQPDLFIGANRLNQIPFSDNWASGFSQLTKKLEKDAVPKSVSNLNEFSSWYENKYMVKNGITKNEETYYTSLWPLGTIPSYFYLFVYRSEEEAKLVQINKEFDYPVSRISNVLATFCSELPDIQNEESELIQPLKYIERHRVSTEATTCVPPKDGFPTDKDCENHFKSLLSRVFHLIMKKRGLYWDELSNKRLSYFYTPAALPKSKVNFPYPRKKKGKTKSLFGRYLDLGKWHYAVSSQSILLPFYGYSLKSHLIFTSNGFQPWEDKKKIHSHRRSKGKMMFNEEWRDLQLAFIHGLVNENNGVSIALSPEASLVMEPTPLTIKAPFGYQEPSNKNRLDVLEDGGAKIEIEPEAESDESNE